MNDIPQEILTRIDALAAMLGTTVEALWPAMVAAERAGAIGQVLALLGCFVLLAAGGAGFLRMTIRSGHKSTSYGETKTVYHEGAMAGTVVLFVLALVMLAVLAGHAGAYSANIVAPEAAAARELLEALK